VGEAWSLDDLLDRIQAAYGEGNIEKASKDLGRALKKFPGEPALYEWQAILRSAADDPEGALESAEALLDAEPGDAWARRFRTEMLVELGLFEEALEELDAMEREGWRGETGEEEAAFRSDRAVCLDRLDRAAEADREFREAARIDPEGHPMPLRLTLERFEDLVARAMESIPPELSTYLEQVMIVVREHPGPDDPGPWILGLYSGVPRTERTQESRDNLDRIFIFKRNHETLGLDEEELEEEVRKTVIHEIAHHFGFGEDDMGDYA
jgi:predicted Zn-dependent protease with MMP-like domain